MKRINFLTEKRRESGFLAKKVAKDMGFSRATLYRKESGKTPLKADEIKKFAQYYNLTDEDIREHIE